MRLHDYSADHRFLLEQVAEAAGFEDPVAVNMGVFTYPVMEKATRGPVRPVGGVLVRDWDPDFRRTWPGFHIGMRLYRLGDVTFARVRFTASYDVNSSGLSFTAVDRKDYLKFYRLAVKCRREQAAEPVPPILDGETLDTLSGNTIDFLGGKKLDLLKKYGGRPKRGVLLTGPPGNGKTSACRWLKDECLKRHWDFRMVTPELYKAARQDCDSPDAVKNLFQLDKRGIVFFDDMDIALRDRETVHEGDDQAVFLTELDGIEVSDGVVYVFTTNCRLELIDPAFRRPGRIDVVLDFPPPTAELRRRLMERWHPDIRAGLDLDDAVADTDGYSFAEIEELKNLLLQRFIDVDEWDWGWALRQFAFNRKDLGRDPNHRVGFGMAESKNGAHC